MAEQATPQWTSDSVAVFEDGKTVSVSNSCFHCKYSLQYCHCHIVGRTPRAIHPDGKQGYVEVTIKGVRL